MKTALITGDQGFVARHMRPLLEDAGYEVTGFDVKQTTLDGISRSMPGVDARDFFRAAGNDETHWDLVIHLAAVVGGRQKIEGAPLDLAVDLSIDAEMFAWAVRARPGKVIYFSSSAAYPVHLQSSLMVRPLAESEIDLDDIATPDMTYGWAKLTGEMLAKYARQVGVNVLVVRPFSGYGTDQDLDYPFPSFIDRARRKVEKFEIWGDGQTVRDWIHIDDICGAVLSLAETSNEETVNLGTGIPTSFNELARLVCEVRGYEPVFLHRLDAPQGVRSRVCRPGRMLKYYVPRITLRQGVEMALNG